MAEDSLSPFQTFADICDALMEADIPFQVHFPSKDHAVFTIETHLTTEQLGTVVTWGGALEASGVVHLLAFRRPDNEGEDT